MIKKKKDIRDELVLTPYEQEIEDSITEEDLLPPGPEQLKRIKELQDAVIEWKKRKLVSLRIQRKELALLKEKAEKEWLPYQTLINLLVHKYNRGEIKISFSE